MQYLEEKMHPIKKIVIQKIPKKNQLKFERNPGRFPRISLRDILTPYLGYRHAKFGMNRTSRLGMSLYTDRQTDS